MNVVVICTYNEADNIAKVLDYLTSYKVILVDDSSPDGTAKIAANYSNVEIISRPGKLGIASAYLEGFKKALEYDPKFVIQMDAGLTHNPTDIPIMISLAEKKNLGLVIGSRFFRKNKIKRARTFISLAAALLMRFIHINVHDATSGFRCWRATTLKEIIAIPWLSKGFAFQLETLHLAYRLLGNNRIGEIPIQYRLTNSSFNYKMLWEALWIYSILLFY